MKNKIIKIVSEVTGVPYSIIILKLRTKQVVEARQLCSYFLINQMTLEKAGKLLHINHSTVHAAARKIDDLLSVNDKDTCYKYQRIKELCDKIQVLSAESYMIQFAKEKDISYWSKSDIVNVMNEFLRYKKKLNK